MRSPQETVNAFIAAVEAKDIELAKTFVHDDISYENVPVDPIAGKEAMGAMLEAFLAAAGEVEWVIVREIAAGDVVANERIDRFKIGDGWLELPVAGFFVVEGELITLWRDYFDMNTYVTQLGALQEG